MLEDAQRKAAKGRLPVTDQTLTVWCKPMWGKNL
jgi:hypothetical protein